MRKRNIIVPGIILIVNFLILFAILVIQPSQGASSDGHKPEFEESSAGSAYIVIQYEPGDYQIKEINIHSPVSGFEALESSGVNLEIKDFGDGSFAVCSIEGVGCPADDCFCEKEKFWNYEYWDGETWQSYQIGAADSKVESGVIEGWRWGEFESDELPPAAEIIPHE